MNNKKTERLLMEHELLNLASSINQIKDSVSGLTSRYGNVISDSVVKRLNKIQGESRTISKMLLSSFDDLDTDEVSIRQPQRYDAILVDQNLVGYESEKKILVNFPENSEFNGYSVWINHKYFTKSIDGDGYQIRFYPDSLLKIHKYEKEADKYVPVDTKEITGAAFKDNFSGNDIAVSAEDSDTEDYQLVEALPDLDIGIHY